MYKRQVLSFLENQPMELPTRLEAGTLNGPGIAGLLTGVMELEKDVYKRQAMYNKRTIFDIVLPRLMACDMILADELAGLGAVSYTPLDVYKRQAEYTEKQINYGKRFAKAEFQTKSIVDAISHATCAMARDVDAKCIRCV